MFSVSVTGSEAKGRGASETSLEVAGIASEPLSSSYSCNRYVGSTTERLCERGGTCGASGGARGGSSGAHGPLSRSNVLECINEGGGPPWWCPDMDGSALLG